MSDTGSMEPGASGPIRVVIDPRERPAGVAHALERIAGVAIQWNVLPTGDYLVPSTLLVKRKTIADLGLSLVDGRLFRQATRLVAQPLPALFIVEGSEDAIGRLGVRREAVAGALVSLVLVYGLPVVRALDACETARLILYAADQLRRRARPASRRPPPRRARGRARQIHILQGFPGVGPRRAAAPLDAFGSIGAALRAGERRLAAVPGTGPAIARRIREALAPPGAPQTPPQRRGIRANAALVKPCPVRAPSTGAGFCPASRPEPQPAVNIELPVSPDAIDLFLSEPHPGVEDALRAAPGDSLVLGAAGKMGLHLCMMLRRALTAMGRTDRVVAVSRFRTLHATGDFTERGIEVAICDLEDRAALERLPDCPNVFFLAGAKFGTSNRPDLLERMNVLVPRLVAERFAHARVVALSTGCVYPYVAPGTGGSIETDTPDPVGDYAISCLGREREFERASRERGARVSLIRLNYSTELRYGVLVDLCQKVLGAEPVDASMGHVNVIWQRDALAHILRSLPHASAPPFVLNVTGPDILSVRTLAHGFGERLGRTANVVGSEAPTAWLSNAAKAHALFGPPPTPLALMMDWTASWIRGGGATHGKPTGFQVRDGRF